MNKKKVIFSLFFIFGIDLINPNGIIYKIIDKFNMSAVVEMIIYTLFIYIFLNLAGYIIGDSIYNKTVWNKFILKKYSIKSNKYWFINLFSVFNAIAFFIVNFRKLKLHRGLR